MKKDEIRRAVYARAAALLEADSCETIDCRDGQLTDAKAHVLASLTKKSSHNPHKGSEPEPIEG